VTHFAAETRKRGEVAQSALGIWRTFIFSVREIFDENAYERFLARTNSARSVASYRAFLREREASILEKPRCC
jgi:hypothetical protein